ncbi:MULTISPECIES: hypothetical protein [unclassified Microcoleus]|uniref:hypothetical protein n=1 Tax=unclassified Microcoleus TaxID=2642155 RepID=UPI002FD64299
MTIIAHPVQDPEKRTPGFKSLVGISVRSGRNVFNLPEDFYKLLTNTTNDYQSR